MGGAEASDIFLQIRSLVSDQLLVISYKWLSRKFSVSSNDAKRLLKEFIEKHGNDLQVIYTVSGWLKSDPATYCVKLASASKIDETRDNFEGICSVQVYSVQACIPKETAVIWNSEFVQAEELFNQPPSIENCLRDNRFCGVSNSHVTRKTDGKHTSLVLPNDRTSAFQRDLHSLKPVKQEPAGPPSSINLEPFENKSDKEKATKPSAVIREPSKLKGQNGKSSSANSGSLANMWGRASTKPKPVKETAEDVPNVAATADEQIYANEVANDMGSDDEFSDINYKRDSNNRKRRVIFYFSDDENEDEDEEKVMSLSSPPEPQKKSEKTSVVKEEKNLEDRKLEVGNSKKNNAGITLREKSDTTVSCEPQEKTERTSAIKEEKNIEVDKVDVRNSKDSNAGITLIAKSDATVGGKGQVADTNGAGVSGSPKRRKVLKTRIDDRGREVSEFVWEGEPAPSDQKNQENAAKDANNRSMVNKAPALAPSNDHNIAASTKTSGGAGASSASTIANKPGGNKKPAKAGTKDAKQGNILSFFKKI